MADDNIFDYNIGTTSSSNDDTDVYGILPPLDSDHWDVAMQSEQPSSSPSELDTIFVPPGPTIDMAAAALLPFTANSGPAIGMEAAAMLPSSANGGHAIDMAAAALLPFTANSGPAIGMEAAAMLPSTACITKAYTRTSEDSEDEEEDFDFTTKKVKRCHLVNPDFQKHVHDVMDIGHRVAVRELQDNSAISSDVGGEDQHCYQDGNDRLSLFDLKLRPWDKKTNAAKWTFAEQQTKNIWLHIMTDVCRTKQYILKWVGMGGDENGCTVWLYEKQEKKTRKRAVEAVEAVAIEEQSDEELMDMLSEANRPGNWNRMKYSKLATLLAKRAVIAAAKDEDFQQLSETSKGVTKAQVLEWMNDSETFNGYEQIMRGKWSSNFDLKMYTALKDAGYKQIFGGGKSGETLRYAVPRPTDGQNNCLSAEYESEKDKSERQFPKKKKQKTQEQSSKNSKKKKKKAKKVPKAEEEEEKAKKGKQHAKMKAEVEERISEAAAVTQQTTSAVTQHAAV